MLPQELAAYFVDLQSQEQEFRRLIAIHRGRDEQGAQNPSRTRPLVLLLPGWTDHAASYYLLERLIYDLRGELHRYDDNYQSLELDRLREPKLLECVGSEDPEQLESRLIHSVRKIQFGTHPLPADPRLASDYIRNFVFTEPVIFYAHLDLAALKIPGPVVFLRRFYKFWGEWGDQNHLLLICVFVSYLKSPRTAWEKAIDLIRGHNRTNQSFKARVDDLSPGAGGGIEGAILPAIPPLCKTDATQWASEMKRLGILGHPRAHRDLQNRIEYLFSGRCMPLVNGCLPFGELCELLDGYLCSCQSGTHP